MAANIDTMQVWARGERIVSWTLVGTLLTGLLVHVLVLRQGSTFGGSQ